MVKKAIIYYCWAGNSLYLYGQAHSVFWLLPFVSCLGCPESPTWRHYSCPHWRTNAATCAKLALLLSKSWLPKMNVLNWLCPLPSWHKWKWLWEDPTANIHRFSHVMNNLGTCWTTFYDPYMWAVSETSESSLFGMAYRLGSLKAILILSPS